jgi:hypothetical protein
MARIWKKITIGKRKPTEPTVRMDDIDRLWDNYKHEDNILATRVSIFLVAQSVLIAVAASLINAAIGLSRSQHPALRGEVFGLTAVLIIAGLGLTLVSWYIFTLNFDSIGTTLEELKADPLFLRLMDSRARKRNSHWHFRIVFRRKGMNWVTVNGLPFGLLILWCAMGAFLLVVFLSS